MLSKEVLWCSVDNWHAMFKKVTFKSVILPIPNDVLEYLRSDGPLILPKECGEKDNEDSGSESDDENESEPPSFPEFNSQIEEALATLGGAVFAKLNWSAPRDAAWMGVGHSLKCESLTQIWLLLKSSEFIVHDLTQPFKDCSDDDTNSDVQIKYVLALKKWSRDVNPATEFRCFIRNRHLIAIEQRDTSNFYSHILEEKDDILRDINSFFNEHVKDKLAEEPSIDNVVMDITRPFKDVVKLIDFNPFGPTTDINLFQWTELDEMEAIDRHVDFRYVQSSSGIQPTGLRMYSLPKDIVDLANGTDHDKLIDFLKLQTNMQNKE